MVYDRVHAVDNRMPVTRRSFLQAINFAFARSLCPLAAGFTAVADDLVWLMRWCGCGGAPRFAGAG